jgi:hypothetical protein
MKMLRPQAKKVKAVRSALRVVSVFVRRSGGDEVPVSVGLRAMFALAAACSTSMLRGVPRRVAEVSVVVERG